MKPYIFWPKDYYHYSGGVRALHWFCHYLNKKGQEAYITTDKTNPRLDTPSIDISRARVLIDKGAIAIYPERVTGNPWNANKSVRFLLHKPGYFDNGEFKFSNNEILVSYSKLIDKSYSEDTIVLNIPAIDTDLFSKYSNNHKSRTEKLLYVGKGIENYQNAHKSSPPLNARELTLQEYPTREAVADALHRAELLYTFDDYTLLIWEARLCGCPVFIFNNEFEKKDIISSEYGENGLAFSQTEVEWAKETVSKSQKDWLENYSKFWNKDLSRFIRLTQEL